MSLTLEDLSTILNEISATCSRILQGISIAGPQVVVVEGLSDISNSLGLVKAGEFRSGTGIPNNTVTPFSGVRIGSPGWTYDTKRYAIAGLNSDVLQFGLSNEDGSIYAGAGAIKMDANGLTIIGEGSSDYSRRIKFYYNSGGTLYPMMYIFSDYGTPGGNMTSWIYSRRDTGSPWSDAKLGLRVIDQIASKDITFSISSIGDVSVGGGTFFQVGTGMSARFIEGVSVGYAADPSKGNIAYSGELISRKNNADVAVYGFHPLTTPLTSTSWDMDARSTTAKTLIDLSAVFNAPAGIKAVLAKLGIRDSGSAAGSAWFVISPNNANYQGLGPECSGKTNDTFAVDTVVCPCNADGDIYYQIAATGTLTADCIMEIWGYYI